MTDDESEGSGSDGADAESEPLLDGQTITNGKDTDSVESSDNDG